MQKKIFYTIILLFVSYLVGFSQERFLYKKIDTTQLYFEVYPSAINNQTKSAPAMVFFFCDGCWTRPKRS